MSKRFTDDAKWSDPWFRSLSPSHKLAWLYLCDRCDQAGVIDLDVELANFQVGDTLDWDAFVEAAHGRVVRLECGKLWVRGFIAFQYGELSQDCRPHQPVLRALSRYAATEPAIARAFKGYPKGIDTLKEKEKEKDKDQDQDRKGGARGGKPRFTADDVPVPEALESTAVREAIAEWLSYKAKRGQPYKDASYLGRKLREFPSPESFIAAVNSSIGNNYAGIFPPKEASHGKSTTRRSHRFQG